jgi:hypothetical protein
VCPLHYWLEPVLAEQLAVPLRPPGFLEGAAPHLAAALAAAATHDASGEASLDAVQLALAPLAQAAVIRVRSLPETPRRGGSAAAAAAAAAAAQQQQQQQQQKQRSWPARLGAGRAPNELTWDAWCSCVHGGARSRCVERRVS